MEHQCRGRGHHDSDAGHAAHNSAVVLSLLVASLGILGAWFLYVRRRDLPAKITGVLGAVYVTVRHRYYVDEGIKATFIRGTMALAAVQKWFDEHVIDGLVNFVGHANRTGGAFSAWFDRIFVDGAVSGIALVSQSFLEAEVTRYTPQLQMYQHLYSAYSNADVRCALYFPLLQAFVPVPL